MQSLVGLRAVDITRKLGEDGYFTIGSYNKPIATVIPPVNSREDLIRVFRLLERKIENGKKED